MEKMDTLLDQNKIIARGLTLMHEINSKPLSASAEFSSSQTTQSPVEEGVSGYQRSRATGEGTEFESPVTDTKFKKLP
mgnify:FL=1